MLTSASFYNRCKKQKNNMKNQIINITSVAKGVRVTVRNSHKKLKARRFPNVDQAKEFALQQGDRQTNLYLNGFKCVLAGWTA
jgi:hypothetical protein